MTREITPTERLEIARDREDIEAELAGPDLSEFPEYEHHVPEGWMWLLEFVVIGLLASLVGLAIMRFHIKVVP